MGNKIPIPAIERLAVMKTLLERLNRDGRQTISSAELGKLMNIQPHTIRKDISYLGQAGGESGYDIPVLIEMIKQGMGLNIKRKACIVGLGRLGTSIMDYSGYDDSNLVIAAGFDSNINRIETLKASVPLYPAHRITEIVRSANIEIGIIAVPVRSAQVTAERLLKGGIRGMINFAPTIIKCDSDDVIIRNMHLLEEFQIVSALIDMSEKAKRREN